MRLNINDALQSYAPFILVKDSLENRNEKISDSIISLESKFEKRIKSIYCGGTKTYYANLELELLFIQKSIDSLSTMITADIDSTAKEIIRNEVNELICSFAIQNNISMVLDESKVYFFEESRDITNQFVKFLNDSNSIYKK